MKKLRIILKMYFFWFLTGQADAVIIAAGAGMGVDSGLPDFRGDKGF